MVSWRYADRTEPRQEAYLDPSEAALTDNILPRKATVVDLMGRGREGAREEWRKGGREGGR